MTVQERIYEFVKRWPSSEFGPAHIVLSDFNIEDGHLTWCIGLLKAALSHSAVDLENPLEDEEFMKTVDWYLSQDRREMEATLVFLKELLLTPRAEREEEA